MEVPRGLRAQRPRDRLVKRRVRKVILPADHVRDPEVGVVDHRGEVIGRRAVGAEQGRPTLLREPNRPLLAVGCADSRRRSAASV